jgi:hypothetical protein
MQIPQSRVKNNVLWVYPYNGAIYNTLLNKQIKTVLSWFYLFLERN